MNQIILGDCFDQINELDENSVNLVVSSPPYNIGKEYENRIKIEEYVNNQYEILRNLYQKISNSGSIFWQVGSFTKNGYLYPLDILLFPKFIELGFLPINRIIWARSHGLHAKKKFSARHETILWFAKTENYHFKLGDIRVPQKYQNKKSYRGKNKGELTCNPEGKNPGDVWLFRNVKHNHEEQTIHPCQFPEDLVARIILSTTKIDDLVVDPFMGTGTVPVVAKNLGRRYFGVEIDSSYYEVAQRRISCTFDNNYSFANLKCLRDYVQKTGEDISKYKFDVQVGNRATEREKSKIFSEEYHKDEFLNRLELEENKFKENYQKNIIQTAFN